MEEIKMWKSNDGGIYPTKEECKERDDRILIENEVDEFLKGAIDKSVANYTKSSQRDAFILHWAKLKKFFGSGGGADEGMQKFIYGLCISALHAGNESHKQWFVEEILKLVVEDIEETHSRYEWERGVKPPDPPDEEEI